MVPGGWFTVFAYRSAMQSGSPQGKRFDRGFLIRKWTEKCVSEGAPDEKMVPEMRFWAGFMIRKGFSVRVRDGVPDNIPKPRAPLVTPVCPYRSLLTSGRHWWWISNCSWAMGLQPNCALWPGTENFPHVGTREAMKTPPSNWTTYMCSVWCRSQPDPRTEGGRGFPLPPSRFHHNTIRPHPNTFKNGLTTPKIGGGGG